MLFCVVIPVYNERTLLPRLIERIDRTPRPRDASGAELTRHLVLSDDGSTDGTAEWIATALSDREDCTCLFAATNAGKGAALARGFEAALRRGADLVLVQDADLEYDPGDHQAVLEPMLRGEADAVIGSRFIGGSHRVLYYWHSVANRLLTELSNMLSNLNLTDMECGTKACTTRVLREIRLRERRFGIEPELVARLARLRLPPEDDVAGPRRPIRIFEVPVRYAGRTYAEGKKIGWRDAFAAVRCIVRYNLFDSEVR